MDKTITNGNLKDFMDMLYNNWFQRYKNKAETMFDEDWAACVDELARIIEEGKGSRVVRDIGVALLNELDARRKGGYEV